MNRICRDYQSSLTALLAGDLTPAAEKRLCRHLDACPDCRAALDDLRPAFESIRTALAAPDPEPLRLSDDRRRRILNAARAAAARPVTFADRLARWLDAGFSPAVRYATLRTVLPIAFTLLLIVGFSGLLLPAFQTASVGSKAREHAHRGRESSERVQVETEFREVSTLDSDFETVLYDLPIHGDEAGALEKRVAGNEESSAVSLDELNVLSDVSPVVFKGLHTGRSSGTRAEPQPTEPAPEPVMPSSRPATPPGVVRSRSESDFSYHDSGVVLGDDSVVKDQVDRATAASGIVGGWTGDRSDLGHVARETKAPARVVGGAPRPPQPMLAPPPTPTPPPPPPADAPAPALGPEFKKGARYWRQESEGPVGGIGGGDGTVGKLADGKPVSEKGGSGSGEGSDLWTDYYRRDQDENGRGNRRRLESSARSDRTYELASAEALSLPAGTTAPLVRDAEAPEIAFHAMGPGEGEKARLQLERQLKEVTKSGPAPVDARTPDAAPDSLVGRKKEAEADDLKAKRDVAGQVVINGGGLIITDGLATFTAVPPEEEPVKAENDKRNEVLEARDKGGDELAGESAFRAWGVNPYVEAAVQPFSTFALDVDTASYTYTRNRLAQGRLPEPEAVRTEEIVNFFDYHYSAPASGPLFAIHAQAAPSPFRPGQHLLRIGVKARPLGREENRPAVLTIALDTSGSMSSPERLELARRALKLLVERLAPEDRVALVQFDNHARLVLDHTRAAEKAKILKALDALQTSGSTNLEEGMRLAYAVARRAFRPGASNRVLLISDGAANLGEATAEEILAVVADSRRQGVFCSVYGVGRGGLNDAMLETLANKGDGVYAYLDSLDEARRLFVDELAATLNTVAADVKIQVEFNPARVNLYRQIGYENRRLRKEDFRNDAVDAGEVGSGQSVTALYDASLVPGSRGPLGTVRIRYRDLATGRIEELALPLGESLLRAGFDQADPSLQLAACAAEWAEILRGSPYAEGIDPADVAARLRRVALQYSLDSRVQELVRLVETTVQLKR